MSGKKGFYRIPWKTGRSSFSGGGRKLGTVALIFRRDLGQQRPNFVHKLKHERSRNVEEEQKTKVKPTEPALYIDCGVRTLC